LTRNNYSHADGLKQKILSRNGVMVWMGGLRVEVGQCSAAELLPNESFKLNEATTALPVERFKLLRQKRLASLSAYPGGSPSKVANVRTETIATKI
jgi:hypothetical protein